VKSSESPERKKLQVSLNGNAESWNKRALNEAVLGEAPGQTVYRGNGVDEKKIAHEDQLIVAIGIPGEGENRGTEDKKGVVTIRSRRENPIFVKERRKEKKKKYR